jgi:transposase-like protein
MGSTSLQWVPPHCPNPNCRYFNAFSAVGQYKRKGFYDRQCSPQRIQRFTCLACKRHFSTQTFSTAYWQKRPELSTRIFMAVVGCSCNRQIARAEGCSPETVAHQIARLGRHCLLFQAQELKKIGVLGEIVIDGFETFEWSQYFPFHHNVAVDVDSGYFLFHTDSPMRRKGRMRPRQRARRAELELLLGRAPSRAIEDGIRDLLTPLVSRVVRSDDHRAYPRAIRALGRSVNHHITSSTQRRDRRNPLFEVNSLDMFVRHSTGAHKRETIAFVRRRQASIEKFAIFQVWRNYIKRRWEKKEQRTSAMILGLTDHRWSVGELFRERLFFDKVELSARWETYYRRAVPTAALPVNRIHQLRYAF